MKHYSTLIIGMFAFLFYFSPSHYFYDTPQFLWNRGTIMELDGGLIIYSPLPWYEHYCKYNVSGYGEEYWKCELDKDETIYLFPSHERY